MLQLWWEKSLYTVLRKPNQNNYGHTNQEVEVDMVDEVDIIVVTTIEEEIIQEMDVKKTLKEAWFREVTHFLTLSLAISLSSTLSSKSLKMYLELEEKLLKLTGLSSHSKEGIMYKLYSYLIFGIVSSSSYCALYSMFADTNDTIVLIENFTIGGALLIGTTKIAIGYYISGDLAKHVEILRGETFRVDYEKYGILETLLFKEFLRKTKIQTFLCCATPCVYLLFANVPCIRQRMTRDSDWFLPFGGFPLWDTTYSPNYELALIYVNFSNFTVFICFMTLTSTVITVMAFLSYQCKILQSRIQTCLDRSKEENILKWPLLDDNLKNSLKHLTAIMEISQKFEKLFSFLLLIDFIGLSIIIASCLMYSFLINSYNFKSAQMATLTMAAVVSEFLTTYWGSELVIEYLNIGQSCYEIDFVGVDVRFQKSLRFMIQQTQRPVQFSVASSSFCSLYLSFTDVKITIVFIENFTFGVALLIGKYGRKGNVNNPKVFLVSTKVCLGYYIRSDFENQLKILDGNKFYHNPEVHGSSESKLLNQCSKIIRMQTIFFCTTVGVYLIIANAPCIRQRIAYNSGWFLPYGGFPLWNITSSPKYELALIFVNGSNFIVFICHNILLTAILSVMVFLCFQCKILQNRVKTILERSLQGEMVPWLLLENNLKDCVKQLVHIMNATQKFAKLFSWILLIDFVGFSIIIGLCLMYTFMIKSYDLKFIQITIVLFAALITAFFTSYWGSELVKHYMEIGISCYELDFVGTDLRFQKCLCLMIQQTQQPVQFTVGGFNSLSMRTFLIVIKAAYSYFTFWYNYNNN
ncbi:hypothetical protein FQR65_LT10135 [Abscondita terminalis]|nr:hypothetical protein FQR65_LT10135 [Abscondita terminalis]